MPSHSETAWVLPVAARSASGLAPVQRFVGLLAFSGLALGVLIAARGGCGERHPAEGRNATVAPIMRTESATPFDAACRAQAGRSAKLKPTP